MKLPPCVLTGRAEALSAVPWGGRALAYTFPRRLLDGLCPPTGSGGADGDGGRDRWEAFSSGAAGPALEWPASLSFFLPLAKAGALSKQWVTPRGQCAWAGGPGSSERAEGQWGRYLTSSVLNGVCVKG